MIILWSIDAQIEDEDESDIPAGQSGILMSHGSRTSFAFLPLFPSFIFLHFIFLCLFLLSLPLLLLHLSSTSSYPDAVCVITPATSSIHPTV